MEFYHPLIGLLVPKAHAILNSVGSGGSGVDAMWATICGTFPDAFCNLGEGGIAYVAGIIIDFIFAIIAGAAVLVIIYAGLKLIFAAGSDEATGEAKKIIMYALIGLVLALLGETIKLFVVYTVGVMWGDA